MLARSKIEWTTKPGQASLATKIDSAATKDTMTEAKIQKGMLMEDTNRTKREEKKGTCLMFGCVSIVVDTLLLIRG